MDLVSFKRPMSKSFLRPRNINVKLVRSGVSMRASSILIQYPISDACMLNDVLLHLGLASPFVILHLVALAEVAAEVGQ